MLIRELPAEAILQPVVAGQRPGRRGRDMAAALLRLASRSLDALAAKLQRAEAPSLRDPVLEYHAEAGAPEGALYINGRLVGRVLGVNRL